MLRTLSKGVKEGLWEEEGCERMDVWECVDVLGA